MWLLITFIAIWALSPGPVVVMTLHEARAHGLKAGIAVSAGATLTAALMVIGGILVHTTGFSSILESNDMMLIERIGAFGIILMGLYAAYKSLWVRTSKESVHINSNTRFGFFQGMAVMATYIPQALLFYGMIVPESIDTQAIIPSIIALGSLKVFLIFGWHAAVAVIATRAQNWVSSNRFVKLFEVATACLIVGLGINILI